MGQYSQELPQLSGQVFLCDGGVETDLIFNHGVDVPEFAAHTLLATASGKDILAGYFRDFLALAKAMNTGFILDSQTWKAHSHWAGDLGASERELRRANHASIEFIAGLRDEFAGNARPIVLNGIIGPKGDGYTPEARVSPAEARTYHQQQIDWLAETDVDMVTATTFTQSTEAVGFVRAANSAGLPVVVSFTVETDGRLPSGEPLSEAVQSVDEQTDDGAAYFMLNCAHPSHFIHVLEDHAWARRIHGIRCNASAKSHAELDASDTLDAGNPVELGSQYRDIRGKMPWINIFGGCCGSDLRHLTEIAKVVVN